MILDEKDKKLCYLLQEDAKKTHKQLAHELHLSVTAVFERIKKLEKNNIIQKVVALIDRKKVEKNFLVLCQVKLIQHKKEYIQQFETEIKQFPEILECFHVSGESDYILKIALRDIEGYRDFMVSKLTSMKHIASTQSSFVIEEVKNTTAVFLD